MKKIKVIKEKKIKYSQKQCDDLLSPLVKQISPKCLLCNNKTQVAHHHFKKERCLPLRYNVKNLIPLCNPCHFRMKWEEGIMSCKIMKIKGVDWFINLEEQLAVLKESKYKPDYTLIYRTLKTLIK